MAYQNFSVQYKVNCVIITLQEGEVAVIPMQEELEVRLEESCLPPPPSEWPGYDKMENVLTVPEQEMKPMPSAPYPGHVKLELEGMML